MSRRYGREDIDYGTWFTPWMKTLARRHTRGELLRMLGVTTQEAARASEQHHRAVQATTSMAGRSQTRAHSRNVTAAAGDKRIAVEGVLEIHDLFPEHANGEAT